MKALPMKLLTAPNLMKLLTAPRTMDQIIREYELRILKSLMVPAKMLRPDASPNRAAAESRAAMFARYLNRRRLLITGAR